MKHQEGNLLESLNYRIMSFYQEADLINKGGLPLPRMAVLHPTYLCNHNCTGCDFREQNSEMKIVMPNKDADRILDELIKAGIKAVLFSGGGEPLLAPNIVHMIQKLKKNGVAVAVLTNGSKLEGNILRAVIENCTFLRISLEAGSSKVFQKVKGISDDDEFPRVVSNIKEAFRLRKKLRKNIDISIKFTVGKDNYMDMENAIKLAIQLGVDSIQFKLYENVDSVALYSPAEKYIRDSKGVRKSLEQLKKKYGNKILILDGLKKISMQSQCWLSPLTTTVDALGDVYICPYYRHRMKSHCIGNLLKDDFSKIWYSKRHLNAIKNIKREECNVYSCRFHFYNDFMKKLVLDSDALSFI